MKLHIFGASGTGVTTMGLALSDALNIPYFDSDNYFWEQTESPFTVRRNPEERNGLIQADLDKHSSWILGGSVIDWGATVFPLFDLIVFLWLPPQTRLERLRIRELQRYGNIILSDPARARKFEKFMAWAADYDLHAGIAHRTLQAHEQWLKRQRCPVLEIRQDLTTAERMALVSNYMDRLDNGL